MQDLNFHFDSSLPQPLVAQVMAAIRQAQALGQLKGGERLWSIRSFASRYKVSTFTVAEAYDRLVAEGVLLARRGDGFFLAEQRGRRAADADLPHLKVDAFWLADSLYEPPADCATPGSGWMRHDWYDQDGLRTAMRVVAGRRSPLTPYGDPKGLPALREWIVRALAEEGLDAAMHNVVLTQGASQAITLAIHALTRPGETVLVDDPGYFGLHTALAMHGRKVVGVPWTPAGPDVEAMAQLLQQYPCKVFFTNPWLQNPTGASYTPAVSYQILKLIEQHDLWLVENDVSNGLAPRTHSPLATMDALKRVIYVGSFSKTVAPSLRVGFVVAEGAVADALTHHKMLSGLTSSEITERLALQLLVEGKHRHRLGHLRERLGQHRDAALALFDRLGMEVFARHGGSPFLWVRIPASWGDPVALTEAAIASKVMLAPGALFRVGQVATPWMRFNVAYLDDPRVRAWIQAWADGLAA